METNAPISVIFGGGHNPICQKTRVIRQNDGFKENAINRVAYKCFVCEYNIIKHMIEIKSVYFNLGIYLYFYFLQFIYLRRFLVGIHYYFEFALSVYLYFSIPYFNLYTFADTRKKNSCIILRNL